MSEENLKSFLQETEYCDFNNPAIKELAISLTKNAATDKEKAVILFYWVRDNILYRLGLWQRKASETLQEKEGTCTNKANLLVALLRANNIPAGYGVMKVDGQRYFGRLAPPALTKFASKVTVHIYAAAYLDNNWIKCDPSIDKELSQNTSSFNSTTRLIDWSGSENATMNFDKSHVFEETYPTGNIDSFMKKRARNGRGIQLKIANAFIKFARNNKNAINTPDELESFFKSYLKKNHPIDSFFFQMASLYRDLRSKLGNKNSKR